MITEKQYLNALEIVKQYTKQVEEQTAIALQQTKLSKQAIEKAELQKLKKEVANMTLEQMYEQLFNLYKADKINRVMPARLINGLVAAYKAGYFEGKKLCEIEKKEFLSLRNLGLYSWFCLCDITGNEA